MLGLLVLRGQQVLSRLFIVIHGSYGAQLGEFMCLHTFGTMVAEVEVRYLTWNVAQAVSTYSIGQVVSAYQPERNIIVHQDFSADTHYLG